MVPKAAKHTAQRSAPGIVHPSARNAPAKGWVDEIGSRRSQHPPDHPQRDGRWSHTMGLSSRRWGTLFHRSFRSCTKPRANFEHHSPASSALWVQGRKGRGEAWLPTEATAKLLARLGRARLTRLVAEHAEHVRAFLAQRHPTNGRRLVILTPSMDGAFAWITDGEHRFTACHPLAAGKGRASCHHRGITTLATPLLER